MRKALICIALVISGCATQYKGPKASEIISYCMAETKDLYLTGDCFEQKMTRYMPNWREQKTSYEVMAFTDFIRYQGLQVNGGVISEQEALNEIAAYDKRKGAEIRRGQQSSAAVSAALIQAGAIMMTAPPPSYAPPVYIPPYPSETTVIQQRPSNYRFYDSRPYR